MYNKNFIIVVLLASFHFQLAGQNSLSNASFEAGSCIPDNYYSTATGKGVSFEDCLNDWEACGKFGAPQTSHSPDWFRNPAFNGAQEGTRFVHMVNYEAIQQKLQNEFVDGSYYWISVWVKLNSNLGGGPRDFSTAALNIYLGGSGLAGNKRFEYESDPNPNSPSDPCEPAYRNLIGANDKKLIKQVDLSGYPLDEWLQIQFIYQYQDSKKHDLIAFELIDTDADNKVLTCTRSSICLDNIEIMDPCLHPCISNWASEVRYHPSIIIDGVDYVEIIERIPDPPPASGAINIDFFDFPISEQAPIVRIDKDTKNTIALVENAHKIRFDVYNRWGNRIFRREYFDPNYLRNITVNAKRIFGVTWNGENEDDVIQPMGAYVGLLIVETCQGHYEEHRFIITLADYYPDVQPYPIPWVPDPLVLNCCEPGGLTINQSITSLQKTKEWEIKLANGA